MLWVPTLRLTQYLSGMGAHVLERNRVQARPEFTPKTQSDFAEDASGPVRMAFGGKQTMSMFRVPKYHCGSSFQVCEVYKLHRETFYLAMDFVDRFLSLEPDSIPKSRLQLIGITALFIAAKLEACAFASNVGTSRNKRFVLQEIYPPPLKEFAYVTDQACTAEEILACELIMYKVGSVTMQIPSWLADDEASSDIFLVLETQLGFITCNNQSLGHGISASHCQRVQREFGQVGYLRMAVSRFLDTAVPADALRQANSGKRFT